MDVLAEKVAFFLIMEKGSCDYETATGLALGHNGPFNTIYYDKWYQPLPLKEGSPPSLTCRHEANTIKK